MKKQLFICDKCKAESEDTKFLATIAVGIKYFGTCDYNFKAYRGADLCPKCCEHYGLIRKVIKDEKIKNEPTDIKEKAMDLIVDILNELGVPHSQY